MSKKNDLWGFLGKTGRYFQIKIFNSKTSCISTSFKKIFLSHVAKKLQVRHFSQNCLSKKAPGFKKKYSFMIFFIF